AAASSTAPKPTSWAAALKQALPESTPSSGAEKGESSPAAEEESEEEDDHMGSEEDDEEDEEEEESEEEEDPAVAWPTLPARSEAPRPATAWTRPPVIAKPAPEETPKPTTTTVTRAPAPPTTLETPQVRSSRIIGLGLGGVTTNEIDDKEDDGGGWAKPQG